MNSANSGSKAAGFILGWDKPKDGLSVSCVELTKIFLGSWLTAIAIYLLTVQAFPPFYQTHDDVVMSMIASGIGFCPKPDPHLLYTSFFIGKLLNSLYVMDPSIPWYGLYLATTAVAALSLMIAAILLIQPNSLVNLALLGVFMLVSGSRICCSMQFTSISMFLASAAALLVLSSLELTNITSGARWLVLVVALAWTAVSAMIRPDATLFAAILATLLILCRWSHRRSPRLILSALGFIAVMVLITKGLGSIDASFYAKEPAWKEFRGTISGLCRIVDYQYVYYDATTKRYFDQIGWNENDLRTLDSFFFLDHRIFNSEKMNSLLSNFPTHRSSFQFREIVHQLRITFEKTLIVPSLIFATALIPFFDSNKLTWPKRLLLVGLSGALLVLLLFLMKLVSHVLLPFVVWGGMIGILYCDEGKLVASLKSVRGMFRILPLGAICIFLGITAHVYRVESLKCGLDRLKFLTQMEKARNSAVISILAPCVPLQLISPFESPVQYLPSNSILMSYLMMNPLADQCRSQLDLREDENALLTPAVQILSNPFYNGLLKVFYKDHYDLNIRFLRINGAGGEELIEVYKTVAE